MVLSESTYRTSVAHAITHAPSANITQTCVVVRGWPWHDVVALVLVLDSTQRVALGAQLTGAVGRSAGQAKVRPIIRARGHLVPILTLDAVNCRILHVLIEFDLGIYYTIDSMTRIFWFSQARVTEVDLPIRSTSVCRIQQVYSTFSALRLDNIVFIVIIDLIIDLRAAQSIVVLEQHVIFEVTLFLITSLAAREILAIPAFVGIASDREALAYSAGPKMCLKSGF